MRVAVIGDSHARFWTGTGDLNRVEGFVPDMTTARLGAVTAIGLNQAASPVAAAIEAAVADGAELLVLSFGEVDIRAHVVQLALLRRSTIDAIVADMASSYQRFLDRVATETGLPLIAWGPPPSRPAGALNYNRAIPVTGAPAERNYATWRFTRALAAICDERPRVGFATLFCRLTDEEWRTRPDALFDNCHVAPQWMGSAVAELAGAMAKLGLGDELARWETAVMPDRLAVPDRSPPAIRSTPQLRDAAPLAVEMEAVPGHAELDLQTAYVLRALRPADGSRAADIRRVTAGEADRRITLYERGGEAPSDGVVPIRSTKQVRFLQVEFDGVPSPFAIDVATFAETLQ